MTNRSYNVVKSTPSDTDLKFHEKFGALAPKALPPVVDFRPQMPAVVDQGQLGSCTANAIAAAFQYDQIKQKIPTFTASRLFVYYNERLMEGTVNQDAGAMISDGIKTLNTYGVCAESIWPYNISQFEVKPSVAAYAQAKLNEALTYYSVNIDATSIKTAVALGFPVVIGISVYSSFEGQAVAVSGNVPMPTSRDQNLGGHAVLIVGYDDNAKHFIVRNSWGTNWGQKGYFYLPYTYAVPSLMSDCWVVSSVN